MSKSKLRSHMEKWYSHFEWVPDTAPFWLTVIGALLGVVWVTIFFLIEGGINQRSQKQSDRQITSLEEENSVLESQVDSLSASLERQRVGATLLPSQNLEITIRNGVIGMLHKNPHELTLLHKFAGTVQGGVNVGEGHLNKALGLKTGGFIGFGADSLIFHPFDDQSLLKDSRNVDLQVWISNAANQALVRKFHFRFRVDGNDVISE